MQLYSWPASPYGSKVKLCLWAKGLMDKTEIINVHPFEKNSKLEQKNPLDKIPVLKTPDVGFLYDSRVICDYINTLTDNPYTLVPQMGKLRFTILRQQALGDGILDAALLYRYENHFRPSHLRSHDWSKRQWEKMLLGLKMINDEIQELQAIHHETFRLTHATYLPVVRYLDIRYGETWQRDKKKFPALQNWFEAMLKKWPEMEKFLPNDLMPLPTDMHRILR